LHFGPFWGESTTVHGQNTDNFQDELIRSLKHDIVLYIGDGVPRITAAAVADDSYATQPAVCVGMSLTPTGGMFTGGL
jgi:2-hydroxy-3-keto-5-methylthiopentenyl-1-phosphate phosphatase